MKVGSQRTQDQRLRWRPLHVAGPETACVQGRQWRLCRLQGKSSKEQGNLVVKEAVAAMMAGWGAPFRCALVHSRPSQAP